MIITWLGHASFLIKALGTNLCVDPYAGEYIEKADVILITHGHGDHCDLDKIETVRKADTLIVTSANCAEEFKAKVEDRSDITVLAISEGDEIDP